jgi:hypothetical protein
MVRLTLGRDLQRQGCMRSAFEFARLLFSLDPSTDPHGALLHLDYLAIRAGMGQWLLDVWDFYSHADPSFDGWIDATSLPGWTYSRALALRSLEGEVPINFLFNLDDLFKLGPRITQRATLL